jgi:hypothetical protein
MNSLLEMFFLVHVGTTFAPLNEHSLVRAFGTFYEGDDAAGAVME